MEKELGQKYSQKFQGLFTAVITPFKKGEVDFKSLKKLIRQQVDGGIEGFVVNGTTGESPTLSQDEKRILLEFIKRETDSSVPIVMGTGTNSTQETVKATLLAEKWGADGALVVVPYYNKPPQRGLYAHFKAVADTTRLPLLLYNVPSRTITSLAAETVKELSKIKNIVGIKEASGDMKLGKQIIDDCGPDFAVTSGDDGTGLDLCLLGGCGAISVLSHLIPGELSKFYSRAIKGDKKVLGEFDKYQAFTKDLFCEANPIPVKAALKEMGLIASDELRLPLVAMEDNLRQKMILKMKKLGLL